MICIFVFIFLFKFFWCCVYFVFSLSHRALLLKKKKMHYESARGIVQREEGELRVCGGSATAGAMPCVYRGLSCPSPCGAGRYRFDVAPSPTAADVKFTQNTTARFTSVHGNERALPWASLEFPSAG